MTKSYIIAIVIALLVVGWLASGSFVGVNNGDTELPSIEEAEQKEQQTITVRAVVSAAELHVNELVLRGKTEAIRTVHVRAETSGPVTELPFAKGAQVGLGDILCKIDEQDRGAQMEQAQAVMRQRQLELNAAKELSRKGHRSETAVAAAEAAYDAANAAVKRMEVELSNIEVRAPFAGVIEDLPNEVGSFLQAGSVCAVLVDENPFLVTAQLSEREVGMVQVGNVGSVQLITGQARKGRVRFVAKTADPATRTFLMEMEIDNSDRSMREGVTATIKIATQKVKAHRISGSILALDDAGRVGVKIVDANKRVHFMPVQIASEQNDMVWVTGLPQTATIITVGQDFVSEGQIINLDLNMGNAMNSKRGGQS